MAQPEGMDQAAKDAFEAARNLIAEMAQVGKTEISFHDKHYRALTQIPQEISAIKGLANIDLDNTKISDLTPLTGLTSLQSLSFNRTEVSDLSPIAGLTGLQILNFAHTAVIDLSVLAGLTKLKTLWLVQTRVSDLSVLSNLTGLQNLFLDGTSVSDLSAISGLTQLRALSFDDTKVSDLSVIARLTGLQSLSLNWTGVSDLRPLLGLIELDGGELEFLDTLAVRLDNNLARLAVIKRHKQRAKEVLAYLKTLPPWPEPLPWLNNNDSQLRPPTQVTQRRKEPPLARSARAIRATPAQVKFMLSQPRLTQFTAREVAGQIRFALADVKRATNALPEPLATIEEIADALDEVGNMQLAPKQKQRVEEFQLRIAHLEAVIEKLTHQLNDAEKARETADGLAHSQSFSGRFNPALAEESAKTIGFVARTGVVGGAIYLLGATNPIIAAMLGALAVMK